MGSYQSKTYCDASTNTDKEIVTVNSTSTCTSDIMSRLDQAVMDGDFERIQWLYEHEDPVCTLDTIMIAARKGHIKILKYLRVVY